MTNPAGFWAQKNAAVLSATASKSELPTEPKKDLPSEKAKDQIPLEKPQKTSWADIVEDDVDLPVQPAPTSANGKTNGIANGAPFRETADLHPSQEKKSWRPVTAGGPSSANGSGAKEEWNSFPSKREVMLEKKLETKEKRIQDLESELGKKDSDKNARVQELEAKLQKSESNQDDRIQELESELQKKQSWIEELVAQVDEKDRQAQALEQDLDKKGSRIHELEAVITTIKDAMERKEREEKVSPSSQPQLSPEEEPWVEVDKPSAPKAKNEAPKDAVEATREEIREPPASDTETMSELDLPEPVKKPELPASPSPPAPQTPRKTPAPSVAISKASTPKDVPPPKPAPKLSFPLKNGGKIEKTVATETWANHPDNAPGSWSAGQTTKDIRDMTQAERQALGKGPAITVMVGKDQFKGVPKHMFMYVSPKVRAYFDEHPNETYISLPEGKVARPVMQLIVDWLKNMCTSPKVYSLKLRGNTMEDLAIRRDCYWLGMEKYVAHFTRQYCDKVRADFPGLENVALIEKNTADDDTLFRCVCNNLAVSRLKKNIPEPEKFEAFLEKHPRLAQAIGSIEVQLKANRSGASTPKLGPKKGGKKSSPLKANAGSAEAAPES
jgi:hypothetical protein